MEGILEHTKNSIANLFPWNVQFSSNRWGKQIRGLETDIILPGTLGGYTLHLHGNGTRY